MLKSFHLALKSIWSNKMRSFLTMLGIIIGVAAVIILVGLVNGQMSYMKDSFSGMGTNQLNVNLVNLSTRSVSDDEMYEFYEENREYFDQMSPSVSVSGTVKYGNESLTGTTISGVSEEYLELKKQDLTAGRFLQYSDLISRQKVCVIGYYLASELCGGAQNAIGETIHINGEGYTVVGCVERQTSESDEVEEGGSDDFIYLPYTAAVKLSRNGTINNYVFTVKDTGDTEIVKTLLSDFLYPIFKNEDLYRLTAMSELLDSLDSMIAMMSMMLGGIAGISLLVAGVGVMNIMLVSVTERTAEIGLKKALGARKKTILGQFLTESVVLTSTGGVIGVAAGIILAYVISHTSGIPVAISVPAILIGVGFSMLIGIVFGLLPSVKAANLDPIQALQRE